VRRAVRVALDEDLGAHGDVTSVAALAPEIRAAGHIVARSPLVLAGLGVAREVFLALDPAVHFVEKRTDGDSLLGGDCAAEVSGSARAILAGERTALNFLMRMCGIATATATAVDEVEGTGARILDTRKTAPGLRALDKYAVTCGGGMNHRMGLFDAVMIKDTHLGAGCTIGEAVRAALAGGQKGESLTVEVRDLDQLEQAIAAGAGRALLDNMDPGRLREAVQAAGGRIVLEASGGLRPGLLREVAESGVDFLSLGWLTHSAPAADLALEMKE